MVGTGNLEVTSLDDIKFEDSSYNQFNLYAAGRENFHYARFVLELQKRQSFLNMMFEYLMCKRLFRTPSSIDSVWLEIPIERAPKADALVSELLIVSKNGYFLEEIKQNLTHVDKLLSLRLPTAT